MDEDSYKYILENIHAWNMNEDADDESNKSPRRKKFIKRAPTPMRALSNRNPTLYHILNRGANTETD